MNDWEKNTQLRKRRTESSFFCELEADSPQSISVFIDLIPAHETPVFPGRQLEQHSSRDRKYNIKYLFSAVMPLATCMYVSVCVCVYVCVRVS
jgi:hypothetical protein